jgi:hypothetical protein
MIEAFPLIRLAIINIIFLLAKLNYREWLNFNIAQLRAQNRNNMRYIGISEKEVMAFTDNLGAADEYEADDLMPNDYKRPAPDVDSLAVQLSYARQLDSLRQAKKGAGK